MLISSFQQGSVRLDGVFLIPFYPTAPETNTRH
jgi:hypothetical protein